MLKTKRMGKYSVLQGNVVFLVALLLVCHGRIGIARKLRSNDGSEEWGYVQVRPKAHMFWWLYRSPYRVDDPNKPWPLVLWLQGGPGASGTGIGNFQEVGPLDTNLKPRNSTWLKKADLLFVDNPVGTGYSFVEDKELLVKSDEEAGADLTALLMELFNKNEKLQKTPLYVVAESYGGKFAVTLALAAHNAILSGKLNLTFGGIALGDSWISPEDFIFSWGPLLKDVARLDDEGAEKANSMAEMIKEQLTKGEYEKATDSWSQLESTISSSSNNVDFYNFLLDNDMDPLSTITASDAASTSAKLVFGRYSNYINSLIMKKTNKPATPNGDDLSDLMEGPIRKKLKIIPANVTWGGQSGMTFTALEGDFMKPRIAEVDELLSKGVNVTIYSGQLDVICATKGTQAWVQKLKWEGLKIFQEKERTALYCGVESGTKGFKRSHQNLHFYWILGAGHFDIVQKLLSGYNWLRALRMTSYGFLFYGPGCYVWYQNLVKYLPQPTVKNLLLKVFLHQIVIGPSVIAVVFAWDYLWQGKVSELLMKYQKDALPTLLFGFRFWTPYSLLNYWLIPLQAQVAFMSLGSIYWNFVLSSTMSK